MALSTSKISAGGDDHWVWQQAVRGESTRTGRGEVAGVKLTQRCCMYVFTAYALRAFTAIHFSNILLADEPTAALDSKSGRDVVELMHGLGRNGDVPS